MSIAVVGHMLTVSPRGVSDPGDRGASGVRDGTPV